MGKREEQKALRKQQILEQGLILFVEKGYRATKISDIAKAVDMSVGLMFHYFESKEKLYEELVLLGLQGTQSAMVFDEDQPLVFFEQAVNGIFKSIRSNPLVAKMFIFMERSQHNMELPDSIRTLANQVNNIPKSVSLIEKGQKNGEIKNGDSLALSLAFWCSIQGIAETIAMNPNLPCPEPEWVLDIIRNKENIK